MIKRKDQNGWEELIIETVVKGTGKENAWRRKVVDNRHFQIYERLLYQRGNKIKTVSKNSHFLRASSCSIPYSLHVLHGRCHLYFTGDETETKGGVITCSRSHSSFVI